MKKILTSALLTGMCLVLGAAEIVKDGKTVAKIYLKETIEPAELPKDFARKDRETQYSMILASALKDLEYHLEKMAGVKPEQIAVTTLDEVKGAAIILGELTGLTPEKNNDIQEGFRLKVDGERIYIAGSDIGVAYGIYELLEQLGCKWVWPGADGEVIPQKTTLSLANMDISQAPAFAIRNPWYGGNNNHHTQQEYKDFNLWKMRQKMQPSGFVFHPLDMRGGHVWDAMTRRTFKKEFEENPEMLALVRLPDGSYKRQGPQLETTHPGVLELFEKMIREMFEKNKWPKDYVVTVGVGPADGLGYSESMESKMASSGRIDPTIGSNDETDLLILLCNKILERMGEEFPNLSLGFYLYSTHADFPMRYTPNPRITLVLADISYSRFHGLFDDNSKTRRYYADVLEQWSKVPNVKILRGYNWNLAENFLPYSKIRIWGEDLPFYHKMGVIGVRNESIKAVSVLAPSNYVEARLLWNVNQDWHIILREYCEAAFGKGAKEMEEYYLKLTERQHSA